MLKNLQSALRAKGMDNKKYASFLGISEKSVYNKITGETDFTLSEIIKTGEFLFPQYKLEYLFARDDLKQTG